MHFHAGYAASCAQLYFGEPSVVDAGNYVTVTIDITDDISGTAGSGLPGGMPVNTQHETHAVLYSADNMRSAIAF